MSLNELTVKGLISMAKENGISGYSNLKKEDLINLIEESLNEKEIKKEVRKSPMKIKKYDKNCISKSLITLKPHQIAVAKYFDNHRGLVAAFEVGSGKTLAAIAAAECALAKSKRNKKPMRIIVITPKTLRENFRKEMVKYGLDAYDPNYTIYTPTQYYYAFKRGELEGLCEDNFLIVDEAHNLKKIINPDSFKKYMKFRVPDTIAMSIMDCALKAKKVLLLTATPVPNRIHDILNLVAMVKGEMPLSKQDLYQLLRNKRAFKRYFKCLFSFYRPDRSKDYPKIVQANHGKVEIEMTPKYYKEYMKIERKKESKLPDPWIFYIGLRQASNTIKECIKCDYVMDVVNNGEKTLIYSAFKSKGVETLAERLDAKDIPYLKITGETPEKRRQSIVDDFNDPEGANVLFITNAGAEGLDLKGVREVILFESLWNINAEEQIIGRASRFKSHHHLPKSQRKVRVHKLIIVKPPNRQAIDYHRSADVILRKLSSEKAIETNDLIRRLREISIENTDC